MASNEYKSLSLMPCNINLTHMVAELTAGGYNYTDILLAVQEASECRQTSGKIDVESAIWTNFPEYMEPNRLLQLYVPPNLMILGTFGNVLSFVIMSKNMFKVSTYCYLALLAIMDTFVLYIGLL
ncbi:hypothetical protein DPMN_147416 [Dreissena polymorpha]|uniref:G-protein coupled receptors family 1 profile domain-containing protein n=1 Tax=Dreissena polymorpha TaxID=45954 RepID=A0A9D4FDN8_DREPO|nr:hypothetical protein DPMN_147416 [Dreissena polymorpha]